MNIILRNDVHSFTKTNSVKRVCQKGKPVFNQNMFKTKFNKCIVYKEINHTNYNNYTFLIISANFKNDYIYVQHVEEII